MNKDHRILRKMPKRVHRSKHVSSGKKKGFFFYFKWYFASLFVAVLFFAGTTLLLHNHNEFQCANSLTCKSDLVEHIDNGAVGYFEGKKVIPPHIDPNMQIAQVAVLGATNEPKHIFVDLATQTLYAYQGSQLFLKTLVSTGKWGKTPTGNFHIWEKLIATRMAGGEGADAYDLPNVPWTMYFYQDFALHGAYWHDNFGHPMSHGCVNMRQVDAKTLFGWANGPHGNTLGTEVSVCNTITKDNQCIQNNPIQ